MVHSTVLYILHAKATTLRDDFKGKDKDEERHRKKPGTNLEIPTSSRDGVDSSEQVARMTPGHKMTLLCSRPRGERILWEMDENDNSACRKPSHQTNVHPTASRRR